MEIDNLLDKLNDNLLDEAAFHYGDRYSSDMGLTISSQTIQASPEYDVSFETVMGRNGDLTLDNERLKSFVYPIHVFLKSDFPVEESANRVSKWLKDDIRYKPLFLSWDPDYIYMAIFYERFDIQDVLPKFGKITLNFRCHPVKYRTNSLSNIELTNGMTLFNPENRAAEPLISIEGSGNITLQNNGKDWLVLEGVDGHLEVDSSAMSVYKEELPEFNKMNGNVRPLFPLLNPGDNTITWTGTATKVEIIPRWEAVV